MRWVMDDEVVVKFGGEGQSAPQAWRLWAHGIRSDNCCSPLFATTTESILGLDLEAPNYAQVTVRSRHLSTFKMSFYFAIIGHKDNPLFEHEFGTSKSSGDGISRFTQEQRRMNQFIVHASLDVVEEVQWGTGNM